VTRPSVRAERGQAAVELALVLPVLLTMLYVMWQFGQVYVQYQEVSAATSEGARQASNMASVTDPLRSSTIIATVHAGTTVGNDAGYDHNALNVTVASTWAPGSTVTVTSRYPANVTILGVTLFSTNLTTTRTSRVLN
jgi:Flp pilus assembly protein TadG